MLDRLYDFRRDVVRFAGRHDARVDAVDRPRPAARLERLDAAHAGRRATKWSSSPAPDLANLRNAKNIIDNVRGSRPNDHPPRLVLNGVGMPKRPEISVADFAKTIEMEPIAVIPHDAKLFGAAANNGQMIAEIEPKGRIAEIFADLANEVAGRGEARKAKRGLLDPLIAKLVGKKA